MPAGLLVTVPSPTRVIESAKLVGSGVTGLDGGGGSGSEGSPGGFEPVGGEAGSEVLESSEPQAASATAVKSGSRRAVRVFWRDMVIVL